MFYLSFCFVRIRSLKSTALVHDYSIVSDSWAFAWTAILTTYNKINFHARFSGMNGISNESGMALLHSDNPQR